jgi:hypothetical protein
MVFAGGNRVVTGDALFTKFQPIYNPRITWSRDVVLDRYPGYWDASKMHIYWFWEDTLAYQTLLTSGVVDASWRAPVPPWARPGSSSRLRPCRAGWSAAAA